MAHSVILNKVKNLVAKQLQGGNKGNHTDLFAANAVHLQAAGFAFAKLADGNSGSFWAQRKISLRVQNDCPLLSQMGLLRRAYALLAMTPAANS